MIRSLVGTLSLASLAFGAWAQGINFEKSDWKSVREKAVREKKLIYLDIYTTWCGPCKMMARNYFPNEKAGELYNKNFINYQLDAEKDEGITVAEQYSVTGYPTNLFIDGASGNIIYRTSGMPRELNGFLENAQTAIEESKDPMSLDEYKSKFAGGQYDKAFLKKYLQKNDRLGLDNDPVIDAYLDKYAGKTTTDSTLRLVAQYQYGVDNKGYRLLVANSARLNKLMKNDKYFEQVKSNFYSNAIRKTMEQKDEKNFDRLLQRVGEFEKEQETYRHFYQKEFYGAIGDEAKAYESDVAYANYIYGLSREQVAAKSKEQQESAKDQIRWQLEQMSTPKDQIEGLLQKNMERPDIKYGKELTYANELNNMAWAAYEKSSTGIKDRAAIDQATGWARKGMDLSEVSPETWVAIADTYAHLLSLQGDKQGALDVEKKAIAKAREIGLSDLSNYEKFVEELEK